MKKLFFGTLLLALVIVVPYFNDGRGKYRYWNFSATTHRI